MKLQGVVLTVNHAGRGGWAVVTFEAADRKTHKLSGFFGAAPVEGESLEVEGVFEVHPKFGQQFGVRSAKVISPSSSRGLQLWLQQMPNIGFKRATEIVELFGAEGTLDAIKNTPEKLLTIVGLTQERVDELQAAVLAREAMFGVESTLMGYGLTRRVCAMAIARWGPDESARIVAESPYALCEIKGLGFLTVDAIAQRVGVSRESTGRGRAAARYLLQRAAKDDGHCYLPAKELYRRGKALERGVSEDALRRGIRSLREDGKVATEDDRAYLREMWDAEAGVAVIARRLAGLDVDDVGEEQEAAQVTQDPGGEHAD